MKIDETKLLEQLKHLKLYYVLEHCQSLAEESGRSLEWTALRYLAQLIEGESLRRQDKRIAQRLQQARFPVLKTLDQFQWNWPRKINRAQVQNLFRLAFMAQKGNVIFMGGVGLGKSHLATALGHAACLQGHSVLFATAIDAINTLAAAQACQCLKTELKRYETPQLLILDELGYLPIDKLGADLLFQILSARYEKGATILTTNTPFKHWTKIFNNDATMTSAVLDRVLHHAETVVIEGKSYRMKDVIEEA